MQGQQVAYKRSVTWVGDYLGIIVGLANRLVMQSKQLAAFMLTLHHEYLTGLAVEIPLSTLPESKHFRYVKYTVRRNHLTWCCTESWEEGFDPRWTNSTRYPLPRKPSTGFCRQWLRVARYCHLVTVLGAKEDWAIWNMDRYLILQVELYLYTRFSIVRIPRADICSQDG